MSNNRLRELGYSSEDGRVITCHREGGRSNENRYLHERCGVVRVDLERDTKPGRALATQLVATLDEPRALHGTARDGSVILLFRVNEHSDLPYAAYDGISKLIRDDELVTVTYGSVDQTVDVNAWSWPKGRSPFDVPHDSLAVLFKDIGQRCVDAAFKLGCEHAPSAADRATAERRAKIAQGLKDGSISPTKYQDEQDERDREFLRKNADVGPFDSLWSTLENMRQRLYARKRSAAVED